MSSGTIQLVAVGAQDVYLTGEPQVTFFKTVYKRYTNFSMETINLTYDGTLNWGNVIDVKIEKYGDLLKGVSIGVKVYSGTGTAEYIDWCKAFSFFTSIQLINDQQIIDTLYPDVLQAKVFYDKYVRNNTSADDTMDVANIADPLSLSMGQYNDNNNTIYIPLLFWFYNKPGLALPLIAMQYTKLRLRINLNTRQSFIASCDISNPDTVLTTLNSSNFAIFGDFVHLDTTERKKFAEEAHEYLITQYQRQQELSSFTANEVTSIRLNFKHPCKYIAWNLTGNTNTTFPQITSSMSKATMSIQGETIFEPKNDGYFRYYQGYQSFAGFTNPLATYLYSYALNASTTQPSGSLNYSRINSAILRITSDSSPTAMQRVIIWTENYNILRIMSGQMALGFA